MIDHVGAVYEKKMRQQRRDRSYKFTLHQKGN